MFSPPVHHIQRTQLPSLRSAAEAKPTKYVYIYKYTNAYIYIYIYMCMHVYIIYHWCWTIYTCTGRQRKNTLQIQKLFKNIGWSTNQHKQVGYAITIEECHNNCHFMVFYIHTRNTKEYTNYIQKIYTK